MEYRLPKMPTRPKDSNKGSFGKILNIAGSKYMPGAAYLSSVAALKIGGGYVELCSDKSVLKAVSYNAPEIVLATSDRIIELIKDATVVSIGCGLSTSKDAQKIFDIYIKNINEKFSVIDADGINLLAQKNYILNKNTILTPHPKEASRLLKCTLDEILNNLEQSAKNISKKYNCITVLKTHNTIVTDGEIIYKNASGCSALAKAGSGDVLCGMISGLLAQKMSPFDASVLGVYLHGLTGETAANDLSEYGVLASDLLRYIPITLNNFI